MPIATTKAELERVAAAIHAGTDVGRFPRRISIPCFDEGEILQPCPTCGNKLGWHVRSCATHGRCTREVGGSVADACTMCADYVRRDAHPNIIAARAFRQNLPPYPEEKFYGRGVVIVGGGSYWPGAYVVVRMLRHVGCHLPVQVWYLGARERDDRFAALLTPFDVEVVDALAHPGAMSTRGLTGWNGQAPFQVKSFAVLHSPFEEVLSLDADNYPCGPVGTLFDEPRYRTSGGIFWPDGPATERITRWEQWGVDRFGPHCGWETGQYLVNKRLAWRQLQMARWYDDHGDWCYGGLSHHDHGDKGPWRVGWASVRTAPTFFSTRCVWRSFAFVQPGPDGITPWFIHRCRSKMVLHPSGFASTPQNGTNLRAGLPLESEALGYLEELRRMFA